ncbi:hypothetical protein [Domibacillus robiginosus]|uniref:hypothetical protein n=1 Tax=Domibacillus robiginosus TaxID=1071054 RepID=UPI00067C938F|nr:hypothetical protein [Domibacillus robiginosus]
MLRAIYIGDIRFNECNVFEYDNDTKKFHMVNDREISYDFEVVMGDADFIIFATNGEIAFQLEVKNRNFNVD